MPKGEIKQTIKLAGEKEYNAALKSANTALKTLRTSLKAETAELGANATAQDKNAVKTKSLQKQIQEQEKVVATLTKALAEAKRDYGDNEEVIAKWEQRLNNARATLAGMHNELESLGDNVQDATKDINMGTVATRSFAESLASISSVAGSVSDAIENIFSGVIDIISDTVRDLWDLISDTAAKANRWTDLANYYGSTAKDIQKWDLSITNAAGSFDDFIQLVNTFAYGGKEDKIETWFAVSRDNFSDMIQYTNAVMLAMKDARDKMSREEWNLAMEDIFGAKKSQKAEWFFTNWDNWFEKAEAYNGEENGFGLSDEQLATMNDVWVKVNEIEGKWNAIKRSFAAGFGEITGTLLINVSGGLDALNAFLKADNEADREKALEDLRTNVEEFFRNLAEAIRTGLETLRQVGEELSGSEDSTTAAIGKALVGLTDGLKWITENMDAVIHALEVLAGFWLLGRGADMAAKIASVAANIALIKGFAGAGGAAAGAGGAASAASGVAAGGGLFARGSAAMSRMTGAIGAFVESAPLFLEAGEQIEKWGIGDTLKKWLTLGSHQTDSEVEMLAGAGATVAPEINMLELLLNPAGAIASFVEGMSTSDTEVEGLADSAADAADALGEVADAARQEKLNGIRNEHDRMESWLMGEYGVDQPLTFAQMASIADIFGFSMFDPDTVMEDYYRLYSEMGDRWEWDESVGKFVPTLDGATAAMNAMTMAANELPSSVESAVKSGLKSTPVTVVVRTDDLAAGVGSYIGGQIGWLE